MSSLTIKNLSKKYGNIRALDSVSMEIPMEPVALLGPNGAGKTTLLRILSTLLSSDSGEISFGNINWSKPKLVRPIIGYLPQYFNFYPYLTVKETLEYVAILKKLPKSQSQSSISDLIEKTNLEGVYSQQIRTLSGGTRKRVGIAQALLNNPPILLIDEPTAGLDPAERIRFRNLLMNIAHERLVLISTHIAEDAEAICSYSIIIKEGKIVKMCKIDDLISCANGRIFETKLCANEFDDFSINNVIVSYKAEADGSLIVRYIKPKKDSNNTWLKPSLEDAYMMMVQDTEDEQ
jgi:ABC-2 type transport system ATP-binding protein